MLVQDIQILEKEMKEAADLLDFERAAQIRDLIKLRVGSSKNKKTVHP
jgi:excinuclease UvrABC nuclease subunit